MRSPLARVCASLCWPALLPLMAAAWWLHSRALPIPSIDTLALVPAGVLVAVMALGWRFNRSRVVFGSLALLLGTELAAQLAGTPAGPIALDAVAVLVPLNLALFAVLREKGLLTLLGLLRWALIAGQGVLVVSLCESGGASWLRASADGLAPLTSWSPLGQPALLAFAFAGVVLGVRFAYLRGPIESGLLGALAAAALALHTDPSGVAFRVYVTTGGVVLLLALIESSYTLAYRDELTGLPARRALNETLRQLGGTYTVAMADVDHFKKFNDRHGHDCGDQALRMVAAQLARVRGGGRAFRYGGEEFAIVFPGRSVEEAAPHLEDLRAAIAGARFTLRAAGRPRKKPASPRRPRLQRRQASVTVSIGAAGRKRGEGPEEALKAADKLLYKAKKKGRNRLVS